MKQYLDLLKRIDHAGTDKPAAREGMPGTKSLFGHQFRHNLDDGFPLLTTKKMFWKGVVVELLWFLRGDNNVKYLVDHGVNIWNEDAYRRYCKLAEANLGEDANEIYHDNRDGTVRMFTYEEFCDTMKNTPEESLPKYKKYTLGDCGYQYGKVWREWQDIDYWMNGSRPMPMHNTVDQIEKVIKSLRETPQSRRHIVTAINPAWENRVALYWCHAMFQFNCRPMTTQERYEWAVKDGMITDDTEDLTIKEFMDAGKVPSYFLDCQLYQRSADVFLGVPFNIASYALLTELIAKMCNMATGEFIHTFGDVHIYDNHKDQVEEQLTREPMELPRIRINSRINGDSDIDILMNLVLKDFLLVDYASHPKIEAELSTGAKK